jgi:hypothetical protein
VIFSLVPHTSCWVDCYFIAGLTVVLARNFSGGILGRSTIFNDVLWVEVVPESPVFVRVIPETGLPNCRCGDVNIILGLRCTGSGS